MNREMQFFSSCNSFCVPLLPLLRVHCLIATISCVFLSCAIYTAPNPLECDFPQLYSPRGDTLSNDVLIQHSAYSSFKRYERTYETRFPFSFLASSAESSNSTLQEFSSFRSSYSSLNTTVLNTLHEGEERFTLGISPSLMELSNLALPNKAPKSSPMLIDYQKSHQLLPTSDT